VKVSLNNIAVVPSVNVKFDDTDVATKEQCTVVIQELLRALCKCCQHWNVPWRKWWTEY